MCSDSPDGTHWLASLIVPPIPLAAIWQRSQRTSRGREADRCAARARISLLASVEPTRPHGTDVIVVQGFARLLVFLRLSSEPGSTLRKARKGRMPRLRFQYLAGTYRRVRVSQGEIAAVPVIYAAPCLEVI